MRKREDDEQLPGQLSVFDLLNDGRPCDYSWQREVGQMVELENGTRSEHIARRQREIIQM